MALEHIGLHFPGNSEESVQEDYHYVESTDMCYEVWRASDGDLYVGAYSDSVGLVTWYYATQADVDEILGWE